ncbi:MAG: DUF4064 domain-containing protein [Ferruginibacter sp.]
MTDTNASSQTVLLNEDGKPKLPSGLNVLTILTFIGCGIGLLFSLLTPVINKFFLSMMDKAKSSGAELTTKQLEDMEKGKAVMELTQANMVPLMIIGLAGIALCLVGAIWMRKRKKDGFWIYSGGELLPVIGNFIVLGTAQFTGAVSIIFAVCIPLLFVILYANQRKHLIN